MSLFGQINPLPWTMLAQANPTDVDVTPGAMVSASLILLAMVGSIAMLIVWWLRYQQFGYFLPAAQRGVLRIPAPLMAVTLTLAAMIAALVALMGFASVPDGDRGIATTAQAAASNADVQDSAEPKADASADAESARPADDPAVDDKAAVAATSENDQSADVVDQQAAAAAAGSTDDPGLSPDGPDVPEVTASADAAITQEQMMANMVQMLIFDIGLVAVLGIFVFAASSGGRVWLPGVVPVVTTGEASHSAVADSHPMARGREPNAIDHNPWPDLDEPIETRSTSGGWASSQGAAGQGAAGPVDLKLDASSAPDGEGQAVTDFAELDGEDQTAALNAGSPQGVQPSVEEQFSFMTEVRFALEVFLAAFVPTLVFRLVILGLVMAITGKQPESHPFLEMMDDGVGLPILVMIAFTAIILAPVMEELMYRVIILGGMAQLGRPTLGLIISSVIFCFAHQFPDSLALLPLAFALGYTYLRRRSYITVILVHFLFNAFNMLLAGAAMAVFGYAVL